MCDGLHYNMTLFPNFFNHGTQGEAFSEIISFRPLVQFGCASELSLFLCSLYAPPCNVPRRPCKELCERIKNSCLPVLQEFGMPWPKKIACDKFPSAGKGADCIGAQRPVSPATANPTTRPGQL